MNQTAATQSPGAAGVGLGLRSKHYATILEEKPAIGWFEAVSENYMGLSEAPLGGRPIQILERIRTDYPVVLHGVSMSLGSVDELDARYLDSLKKLIHRIEPAWISDHLCWTGVDGENLHDLLPLPYTEEALRHLARKITIAQDKLGRQMAIENVSAYLSFRHSEMTEWEFLSALAETADCRLLLDVNNVYVSAQNLGFDPHVYLRGLPRDRIAQIHLAGHSATAHAETADSLARIATSGLVAGPVLIDTHDHPVADPVWALFRETVEIFGEVPTMIEWDDRIPEFATLENEARKAEKIIAAVRPAKGARNEENLHVRP